MHSKVTPTTSSPAPRAKRISVVEGSNDTIRTTRCYRPPRPPPPTRRPPRYADPRRRTGAPTSAASPEVSAPPSPAVCVAARQARTCPGPRGQPCHWGASFSRAEDLGVITPEMHLKFTAEHAGDDHSPAVPSNPGPQPPADVLHGDHPSADIEARRFHESRVHAHILHSSPVPAARQCALAYRRASPGDGGGEHDADRPVGREVPGRGVWVRMRTPTHPLWWEVACVLRCSLPA